MSEKPSDGAAARAPGYDSKLSALAVDQARQHHGAAVGALDAAAGRQRRPRRRRRHLVAGRRRPPARRRHEPRRVAAPPPRPPSRPAAAEDRPHRRRLDRCPFTARGPGASSPPTAAVSSGGVVDAGVPSDHVAAWGGILAQWTPVRLFSRVSSLMGRQVIRPREYLATTDVKNVQIKIKKR